LQLDDYSTITQQFHIAIEAADVEFEPL